MVLCIRWNAGTSLAFFSCRCASHPQSLCSCPIKDLVLRHKTWHQRQVPTNDHDCYHETHMSSHNMHKFSALVLIWDLIGTCMESSFTSIQVQGTRASGHHVAMHTTAWAHSFWSLTLQYQFIYLNIYLLRLCF